MRSSLTFPLSIVSETKNQWARDDPAFVVMFLVFLVMSALAWGVAMHASVILVLRLLLWVGLVDFLLFGLVTATLGWFLSNKFLRLKPGGLPRTVPGPESSNRAIRDPEEGTIDVEEPHDSTDSSFLMVSSQQVEWLYAFDIHLNSYFPVWVILYVLQFLILPLILRAEGSFLATLLANTMYLIAGIYYYYVTSLGYTARPFLQRTEIFLYPIGGLVILYTLSLILNVNMTLLVVNFYFS
jgi:hypothetical protein